MLKSQRCRSFLKTADSSLKNWFCVYFVNGFLRRVPANKTFIESKKTPFEKIAVVIRFVRCAKYYIVSERRKSTD